jgi:hypothetical protein
MVLMTGDLDRDATGRASLQRIADWGLDRFAQGLEAAARTAITRGPTQPYFADYLCLL